MAARSARRSIAAISRQRSHRQLEALERRLLLSTTLANVNSLAVDQTAFDSSSILVSFRSQRKPNASDIVAGTTVGASLGVPGLYEINLGAGITVQQAVAAYRGEAGVLYAQPDYTVYIAATPTDSMFTSQWGLNNTGQSGGTANVDINAPEAWNIATGSAATIVAVIDTGVDYTHTDLASNIWANPGEVAGNGKDDDGNGYVDDIRGWNFVSNNNNPMDDNGHGTHVSGIIGARANNGGVVGVNWNVKIMPLKFLDASGSGSLSNAIKALNYAVAKGARISNNSWGGGGYDSALNNAINNARSQGHIFVAAAGNGGADGIGDNNDITPSYPASYNLDNVISVAAVDRYGNLASFSNYGATSVDLAAPGVSILSTVRSGGYATYSGTSMATPFVAGVAALVWSQNPMWSYSQVRQRLLDTVSPLASLAGKTATGGMVNAFAAVNSSFVPPGPYVTSSTSVGSPISSVRVTFDKAVNPATFTAADVSLTGPAGAISITGVSAVSGTNNTQFNITFAPQSAVGTYTLTVGPNITDSAGTLMNQDRDGINGEATDRYGTTFAITSAMAFTSATSAPIRDLTTTISSIAINQDISISDVNVRVNITHTWDGDLRLQLRSPNGTIRTLVNRRGGAGDNFQNTVFDDEASSPVTSGNAPFAGSYRPEQALSGFDGMNARGTWQLLVLDGDFGDIGTLNSWSLTFTSNAAAAAAKGAKTTTKSTCFRAASFVPGAGSHFSSQSIAGWASASRNSGWLRELAESAGLA